MSTYWNKDVVCMIRRAEKLQAKARLTIRRVWKMTLLCKR
jgi:hypothetical protein